MGSSGNRRVETDLNLKNHVGAALKSLVKELECLSDQDQWQIGFEIARQIRTVLFSCGEPWSGQRHEPYEAEIRDFCRSAMLEYSDTMFQIHDSWDKIRLPKNLDPVRFSFECAERTPKKAAVFAEDFPDKAACETAILILTALSFLEDFCVYSGKKPFFPTRLLGEILGTNRTSAATFLRALERLGYIVKAKAKSNKESPPLTFGRRFREANLPGGKTGLFSLESEVDKGSEGSDPKESYVPKVDEGSKCSKRVGNSAPGAPIPRQQQPTAIEPNTSLAASPEELTLFDQVKARQQGEQKRIEKDQPGRLL